MIRFKEQRDQTPEHKRAWAFCVAAAFKRDGTRCTAQRLGPDALWQACARRSSQTAHVYSRRECGAFWANPEVVSRTCDDCHGDLHRHLPSVQFPLEVRRRAFDFLLRMHYLGNGKGERLKVLPKGPRPGDEVFA